MGGDGGVLPTGRKFIRGCGKSIEDKKEDGRNVTRAQIMRTTICAQSSELLIEPIVACEMGNLYNKEAILLAFLDKTLNPLYAHIRGMKDIKTMKFTANPAYSLFKDLEGDSCSKYLCPVTNIEFNGIYPFYVIWTTGLVISEKAVKVIGIDGLQQDYGSFVQEDLVRIIPCENELIAQKTSMDIRRDNLQKIKNDKSNKKDKKTKRVREVTEKSEENYSDNLIEKEKDDRKEDKNSKKIKTNTNVTSNFGQEKMLGSAVSLTSATSLAKKAADSVELQENKSKIFKDLFHKGKNFLYFI